MQLKTFVYLEFSIVETLPTIAVLIQIIQQARSLIFMGLQFPRMPSLRICFYNVGIALVLLL